MPQIAIDDITDERIAPYRRMRDRELAREGDRFLLEGSKLVIRAFEHGVTLHSILTLDQQTDTHLQDLLPQLPEGLPVFTIPKAMQTPITGMGYSSGTYAIAQRPTLPAFADWLTQVPIEKAHTLVVMPRTTTPRNMGSIIRISAALGVSGILIGEQSTDPFYRRATRVSMGCVFNLPLCRSVDIMADLQQLKGAGYHLLATCLDEEAVNLHEFALLPRHPKQVLLLGNEHDGLSPELLALCDQKLYLPMHYGTDSLNVAMSAAVFLYELTRPLPR